MSFHIPGVPKLKRSELETACEDFSNVIGSSSIGTIYKGTLSSGVEIAVATVSVKSAKDWSNNLEEQFRQKVLHIVNLCFDFRLFLLKYFTTNSTLVFRLRRYQK